MEEVFAGKTCLVFIVLFGHMTKVENWSLYWFRELALKAFTINLGRTFQMEVVETIHVTDVRDIGDIAKTPTALENAFAAGARLAAAA